MGRPATHASAVALTAALLAGAVSATPVNADAVLVFPGMEIRQGNQVCTLGYVDPGLKVAFAAGHCRGGEQVADKDGHIIGHLATFRDNTPSGSTVGSDQLIADYEAIVLVDDVTANNVLPVGRPLESEPGLVVEPGEGVCHFGVITGESCGTVERVNNGWFTMAHGIVSQKGDSGGPVYVTNGAGAARIVGIFNSVWGQFPAAVSWSTVSQQVREDVGVLTGLRRAPAPSEPSLAGR
ncbi:S1 family peptidase [Mycobacterium sp. SM1]|uniref:Rv1815 family serine proteinase n=1 Tax=Mycobacterium sp. SM1 TaxID=2816243 RepID=UPI001F46F127